MILREIHFYRKDDDPAKGPCGSLKIETTGEVEDGWLVTNLVQEAEKICGMEFILRRSA